MGGLTSVSGGDVWSDPAGMEQSLECVDRTAAGWSCNAACCLHTLVRPTENLRHYSASQPNISSCVETKVAKEMANITNCHLSMNLKFEIVKVGKVGKIE